MPWFVAYFNFCKLWLCWGHLGPRLGHTGAILGHLGSILGQHWPILRLYCGHVGATLGPSWPISGLSGLMLESCWPIVWLSWPILANIGATWAHIGTTLCHLGAIFVHLFSLPSWPQCLQASKCQVASAGDAKRKQFVTEPTPRQLGNSSDESHKGRVHFFCDTCMFDAFAMDPLQEVRTRLIKRVQNKKPLSERMDWQDKLQER
jgi:hypothetical protein